MELENKLFEELWALPTKDIHTHIRADVPVARGLHDIVLYHMVISELYTAGCPDGTRLSDDPTPEETEFRIIRAIPYLKYIQNTSLYWIMTRILKDIYGWDRKITLDNWREIDAIIKEKGCTLSRAKEIADRCNFVKVNTELWRGAGHIADELFYYSLEWSFFTRSQWGQNDTALLELEYAWNQTIPGPPLPVTVDRSRLDLKKTIRTIEDVDDAIRHYISTLPFDQITNTTSHISTNITYRDVTRDEMIKALENRDNAGEWERDVYANYINETYLCELERLHPGFMVQYSIGAEPLPFETGAKLRTETVFALAEQVARHKNLRFNLMSATEHQDQALCTLIRELPNLYISGFWWHCFFPEKIKRILSDRLDMLPTNKQFCFFSDAYCMDWAYGKALLIKKQLADVLAEKIEKKQYIHDQAIEIAAAILA